MDLERGTRCVESKGDAAWREDLTCRTTIYSYFIMVSQAAVVRV